MRKTTTLRSAPVREVAAWRYAVGRGPDGATRYAAAGKVAIRRNDPLQIERYTAALSVADPPGA